jgi:uncharacterized membrane protein YkvA (DUF1232 family)
MCNCILDVGKEDPKPDIFIDVTGYIDDSIIWNLTPSREYSTTSVYKLQFYGATQTNMNKMVCKV